MKDIKAQTCAIVVVYHPDLLLLKEVLKSISQQFTRVLVIDNGSEDDYSFIPDNVQWYKLKKNEGIAYAHNYGITLAQTAGFDYVCIFDQDSVIDGSFLEKMGGALTQLKERRVNVGAIGPRAISRSSGERYVGKFDKGVKSELGYTKVQQIISSGSLFSIDTIMGCGGFNESMFIDLVDFEWCWRGGSKGFCYYIIEDVLVEHMFGEKEIRLLSFRITAPSAFRIYYQFRNYIWLLPIDYVPLYWKISNAVKLSVKLVLLPIWFWDLKYLKNSIKGIVHGVFKRRHFKR